MKILHVIPTFAPAWRYGGPIFAVDALCRSLVARGHEVHVVTTSVDGDLDLDVPTDRVVDRAGVSVRYFPSRRLRRLYYSPPLKRHLARVMPDFDVVHLHSVFLWPTAIAARLADRARVPYLLAPRGMLVRELIRRRSRLAKSLWLRLVERRTIERAAAIHATSRLEVSDLDAFELAWPPRLVIPNGVDLPADAPMPESPGVAAAPTLVFLGRIHWKKGLDRLLRALAQVPDARLQIAGNDDDGHAGELRQLAASLALLDRVAFLGPLYGADRDALLAQADVVVVPSIHENFANVVVEAMAAGRAVLTTRHTGAAELLERFDAGLVVDGDPDSLARGLRQLLADAPACAAMGRRGRDAVDRHLTWAQIAGEVEQIYARMVDSRKAAQCRGNSLQAAPP